MCQRFSNPLSNNTQDKNRRLQMFQNKIATIHSLDCLKIIVERKTETWPFSTDRQADKAACMDVNGVREPVVQV